MTSKGNLWRRLALLVAAVAAVAVTSTHMTVEAASPVAAKYLIEINVFFRAFCPACQWFVGDPLLELVRKEEFRNIVNLNVFPAAGMLDKNGVLDCEGGDLECEGHRWEVCIIDKDKDDVVKYLGGLGCLEGDESGEIGEWATKLQNCFTADERSVLKKCYDTRSGDLLRTMMKHERYGDIGWMPYTIADGTVLGSAWKGVGLHELQVGVCTAFKGPKSYYPELCQKLVGEQKEFAPEEAVAVAATAAPTPAPVDAKPEATPKPAEPAEKEGQEAVANEDGDEGEIELPMKGDENASDKIRVDLYWRAFCPGCMAFISKPLLKLLSDPEFREIVDFHPVPAVGTYVDETGNFVCTKGVVECQGHRWLSCAIEEFPKLGELIEYLACLERKDNKGSKWSTVVGKCFSSEGQKKMKACYDTKSEGLLIKHIEQRRSVDVSWVPYLVLDSAVVGDARHGIGYKQLEEEVCRAFKGKAALRPTACQPKRLRQDEAEHAKETEKVIKPCPPKKDRDPNKSAAPIEKDAPGAGFRRPDQVKQDLEAEKAADANTAANGTNAETSGFNLASLLFPLGCFVIIGIIARSLSGDHKKDA